MFIRELGSRLEGKPAAEIDYFEFEKDWTERRNEYPAVPSGDPVATASREFRAAGSVRPER
jgi:alpha-N-acetylglucosaminidase